MRSLFPALLLLGSCAVPSLDVQGRYSLHDISGRAGFTSGGIGGSADLEQAGLDGTETISARVDLDFGSPHLIGLVQVPEFRGTGTLDVEVSDGTDTITAGATVDSEVDLDQADLALVFDLVPGDTVELAIGIGAAWLDGRFLFREQGTGTTVESSESVPVPLAVVAGSVWIGPVELAGFVGGVQVDYDGDEIRYLDADVFARLRFLGSGTRLHASIVGGYRRTDLELDYADDSTDVDADFTIDGLYFGLQLTL